MAYPLSYQCYEFLKLTSDLYFLKFFDGCAFQNVGIILLISLYNENKYDRLTECSTKMGSELPSSKFLGFIVGLKRVPIRNKSTFDYIYAGYKKRNLISGCVGGKDIPACSRLRSKVLCVWDMYGAVDSIRLYHTLDNIHIVALLHYILHSS